VNRLYTGPGEIELRLLVWFFFHGLSRSGCGVNYRAEEGEILKIDEKQAREQALQLVKSTVHAAKQIRIINGRINRVRPAMF
jgi:hypothetical protein